MQRKIELQIQGNLDDYKESFDLMVDMFISNIDETQIEWLNFEEEFLQNIVLRTFVEQAFFSSLEDSESRLNVLLVDIVRAVTLAVQRIKGAYLPSQITPYVISWVNSNIEYFQTLAVAFVNELESGFLCWSVDTRSIVGYSDILWDNLTKFPQTPPPMLTKPLDRVSGKGGYENISTKAVSGIGIQEQPASAVRALNILQSNSWKLANHSIEDRGEYVFTKMEKKFSEFGLSKGRAFNQANKLANEKAEDLHRRCKLLKDKSFYFTWYNDFRGRMYPIGYSISPQGDSFEKASVIPDVELIREPATGVLDIKNPVHYGLAIGIANSVGLDKETFEDRFKWVKDNIENLESLENKDESYFEYKNQVKALRQEMLGEVTPTLVYLDASNQALQLYAILLKDAQTASMCNLNNGNKMADAYRALATILNRVCNTDIFTRSNCKYAVMTTLYAKVNAWEEISKKLNMSIVELMKELGYSDEKEFHQIIQDALWEIFPMAMKAMGSIQKMHERVNNKTYFWTMPDGFKVKYDVKQKKDIYPVDSIVAIEYRGAKYPLDIYYKEFYAPSDKSRGLSANIIHSIDGYLARQVVKKMDEKGLLITTIHDAFGTLPENLVELRKVYMEALLEIYDSNLLNDILVQATGAGRLISKGDLTKEMMLKSRYYLG
jgi:hypothetical protein